MSDCVMGVLLTPKYQESEAMLSASCQRPKSEGLSWETLRENPERRARERELQRERVRESQREIERE